jgi:NAD(P)-dependent dehydrogenase (short-subunit alcohol dehydrogenase family)
MRSLVIGASGGIGGALVRALGLRGEVVGLSRSADGLDVTDPAAIDRVIGGVSGTFDRVVIATGALILSGVGPEKSLKSLDAVAMARQFALNAIGPALVLPAVLPLVPRDRPAVVAALSARVGSIGDNALGGWYSYRAAKAALNQLVHTAAIEVARTHRQAAVVVLHPGTVASGFGGAHAAGHASVTPDEAATNLLHVMDGLTAAETGRFFDWRGEVVPW